MKVRSARNRTSRPRAHSLAIDVTDLALLVHQGDGVGAQLLAARRVHGPQRNCGIDLRQHGPHHVAAQLTSATIASALSR